MHSQMRLTIADTRVKDLILCLSSYICVLERRLLLAMSVIDWKPRTADTHYCLDIRHQQLQSCHEMNVKNNAIVYLDYLRVLQMLIHCGLMMPCGDIDLGQHRLRQWLVAWWHQAITWINGFQSSVRSSDNHVRIILQNTSAINH